jgi:hypothetical protein
VLAENRPLNKVRELNDKVEAARGKPEIFADFRKANAKKFRGFMAPENNIKCIEAAVNLPFEEGLKEERRLFMELMTGSQSAAQRMCSSPNARPPRSPTCRTTPRSSPSRRSASSAPAPWAAASR